MTKEEAVDPVLVERMVKLANNVAGQLTYEDICTNRIEARAIVALLPKPIDPDLLEARRAVAGQYGSKENVAHLVEQALSGVGDEWFHTKVALAAIKRGRELAQADAA